MKWFTTMLVSVAVLVLFAFATSAMAKSACPSNCVCEMRNGDEVQTCVVDVGDPKPAPAATPITITNNIPPVPVALTVTTPPAPTATTPQAPVVTTPTCNGDCGKAMPDGKSSGLCGAGWCWIIWGVVGLAVVLTLFFWIRSQRQALAIRRGEAAAARELYIRYNGINPAAPETLAALRRTHQADGEMRAVEWWRPLRSAPTHTLPSPTYEPDPAPPAPIPPVIPTP